MHDLGSNRAAEGWRGEDLAIPANSLKWPDPGTAPGFSPERILLLESTGGRPLTLVSNYPYELWLDGRFAGDGGHRCAPGEALADYWEEAADAQAVRVRLHWLDPAQLDLCPYSAAADRRGSLLVGITGTTHDPWP